METKVRTRDLQDLAISALRYALPRHSYILSSTIDFIKDNPAIIDSRVKRVLQEDVELRLQQLEDTDNIIEQIDRDTIIDFYEWLLEVEPVQLSKETPRILKGEL